MTVAAAVVPTVLSAGGVVELETLAHGARVHRLRVQVGDRWRDVALGHATVEEYLTAGDFMGATIGRYANRIGGGRLPLGGRLHGLATNENGNTLHGGPDGFSSRVWQQVAGSAAHVEYGLESADGDQGFPAAVSARSVYRVGPDRVDLELTATCDALTVVSLTNHAYLNLAGDGRGTVDGHLLTVPADRYTPVDARLLPTGELAPVDGTPFDLRRPTRLGDAVRSQHPQLALTRGIDHNLVPAGEGMRVVAVLEVDDLRLTVSSDAPGLQVYTGNFLDGSGRGIGGQAYRQGDGLCLEPQLFPDAPNQPGFGSAQLLPGELHRRRISWLFEPR